MKIKLLIAFLTGVTALTGVTTAFAEAFDPASEVKVTAVNGTEESRFGRAVTLDGHRLAVGAERTDIGDKHSQGSVAIYDFNGNTWEQTATITGTDGDDFDYFGASVSLDGSRLAVGAKGKGAVYLFDFKDGEWHQTQQLFAADGAEDDAFGRAISLSDNHLAVGVENAKINGNDEQGAVYLFERKGKDWQQTQKITIADGAEGSRFGQTVSLDKNRLAVGASDGDKDYQGSVYLFDFKNAHWQQMQKITANDAMPFDKFGASIALDGNRLVVGAKDTGINNNKGQGSAYLFDFIDNRWQQTQKITASDGVAHDKFGVAVSLNGERVAVGTHRATIKGKEGQGSVYLFDFIDGSWQEVQKLTASDGESGDWFGMSVALDGGHVAVGAFRDSIAANYRQGSVYIYKKVP